MVSASPQGSPNLLSHHTGASGVVPREWPWSGREGFICCIERPSWSACEGRYGVMCHSFCTIPTTSADPSSQGHGVGRPRSQAARQAAKHSRQLPSWHQTSAGCPCTERRAGPAGEALFPPKEGIYQAGGMAGAAEGNGSSPSSRFLPIHNLRSIQRVVPSVLGC